MVILSGQTYDEPLVLYLDGDIDISTTHVLATAVDAAIEDGARVVAINLSRVTFFGSSGIHALFDARDRLAAAGASMTITEISRPVLRALTAADVLEPFGLPANG